jgi:uncharacterized damage-inducible protein DinB
LLEVIFLGVIMDSITYLRKQIKSMRNLQASVLESLADEVLRVKPGGTASPIGVIWLHMLTGEEGFLNTITGEPGLWESAGWKEKFNLEKAPNIGEDWTEYQEANLTLELLKAYTAAVSERTSTILDSLIPEALDETVKFFTESDPKGNVWVLLIGHTLIHSGEIAALKGILGDQGLPF